MCTVKQTEMNLIDFNSRSPNEDTCRQYLKEKREAEGVVCNKCGGQKQYWFENMQLWNVLIVVQERL